MKRSELLRLSAAGVNDMERDLETITSELRQRTISVDEETERLYRKAKRALHRYNTHLVEKANHLKSP